MFSGLVPMGRGSGFGKTILFNEHFVVHGLPGIVSAIDSIADAEVKKTGKGITVEDTRKAQRVTPRRNDFSK